MGNQNQALANVDGVETQLDSLIALEGGLAGATSDGSVTLTGANTWVAVPSGTPPAGVYELVVRKEVETGVIRWSFDNGGVPSATNGLIAESSISILLGAGQVVYFGSTQATDVVNFTTKRIS